jgi:predicted lipoprotein with Yx(FWY)xxD motif
MHRRLILGGVIAVAALGVAGTGVALAESGNGTATSGGYGAPPSTAGSDGTVTTARTGLGQTLVDGRGRTLYVFEADTGKASTCYGACASAWPPAAAPAAPHTTGAASAVLVGTVGRTDGTRQLTYNHHPLYYYAGDAAAGDTTGQALRQFARSGTCSTRAAPRLTPTDTGRLPVALRRVGTLRVAPAYVGLVAGVRAAMCLWADAATQTVVVHANSTNVANLLHGRVYTLLTSALVLQARGVPARPAGTGGRSGHQ